MLSKPVPRLRRLATIIRRVFGSISECIRKWWRVKNADKESRSSKEQFFELAAADERGELAIAEAKVAAIAASQIRHWWVLRPLSFCPFVARLVAHGTAQAGAAVAAVIVDGLRNDADWLDAMRRRCWCDAYGRFVERGGQLVHERHGDIMRAFFRGVACA